MWKFVFVLIILSIVFQGVTRGMVVGAFGPELDAGRQGWLSTLDLEKHIGPRDKVLDFGTGLGSLARYLNRRGIRNVTGLDVSTGHHTGDASRVVVYDGKKIPFEDDAFDVGVACTVLHHIPDVDLSVSELFRTCRRVIIVEDVPTGPISDLVIKGLDSLANWEIWGHPHSNKTDAEWKECFRRHGRRVLAQRNMHDGVFNHVVYLV